MTESITNFSRTTYQYVNDDGTLLTMNTRTAIQALGTFLNATTGAEVGQQKAKQARHFWLQATTREANGNPYRRKVYYNYANAANIVNGAFNGLDGLDWVVYGHTGERSRGIS